MNKKYEQCQTCNRSFLASKMHVTELGTSHEGSPPFSWSREFESMSTEKQLAYYKSITSTWEVWTCNECHKLEKLKE